MTHFAPISMSAATLARMAKIAALPVAALFLTGAGSATYVLDAANSSIAAKVPFLGLGSKTATFPKISGAVKFVPDRPSAATVNVTINTRAITAPDKTTLNRLKSEKFFWVQKYPTAKFKGSNLIMTSARSGKVNGTLTARGVTRKETLFVTFDKVPKSSLGKPINVTGKMTINRRNYGMKSFGLIVGKNVNISLKARMVPR